MVLGRTSLTLLQYGASKHASNDTLWDYDEKQSLARANFVAFFFSNFDLRIDSYTVGARKTQTDIRWGRLSQI